MLQGLGRLPPQFAIRVAEGPAETAKPQIDVGFVAMIASTTASSLSAAAANSVHARL